MPQFDELIGWLREAKAMLVERLGPVPEDQRDYLALVLYMSPRLVTAGPM